MIILKEADYSYPLECPYFTGRIARFEYFFATGLDGSELENLLSNGWRKFGIYYFRPDCEGCCECVPLRVPVDLFLPSKEQRRVYRKCRNIKVDLGKLALSNEVFEVYKEHSLFRFGRESDYEDFCSTFYSVSCESLQSEYYLDERLVAVGFIDISEAAFSSCYFAYRKEVEKLSVGVYSVMREMEFAKNCGLKYYYLGYNVRNNHHMEYKQKFKPHETYDWALKKWTPLIINEK
jgi:arginine-tRNA-protein transferase